MYQLTSKMSSFLAVTGLSEQDSSWQIIESICRTSQTNSENNFGQIGSVLKVQNMPKILSCFEEYREMVKINASNLQTKHPRCLADGYELLRFHGTTVACSLGINGSSSLCTLEHCGICQILRNGFLLTRNFHGKLGVFVTSTCGKAYESVEITKKTSLRKSVIVCRVIAGRVRSPLEEIQEMDDNGFDSLAEKVSSTLDIEELFVLSPRALLPCFVVIYKP